MEGMKVNINTLKGLILAGLNVASKIARKIAKFNPAKFFEGTKSQN